MPRMTNRRIMALAAGVVALLAGGAGAAVFAQAGGTSGVAPRPEQPPYRSSIQVPDDQDEEDEEKDENEEKEREESEENEAVRLQALARVTADQARSAALSRVPGTVQEVELENEDGNLVYSVEVRTATGEQDVKVDAGNARVLHVEVDDDGR